MEIEHLFRSPARAVGLKSPANQGKARLRGLYRIIYSKAISPKILNAKPACAERALQSMTLSPIAYRL